MNKDYIEIICNPSKLSAGSVGAFTCCNPASRVIPTSARFCREKMTNLSEWGMGCEWSAQEKTEQITFELPKRDQCYSSVISFCIEPHRYVYPEAHKISHITSQELHIISQKENLTLTYCFIIHLRLPPDFSLQYYSHLKRNTRKIRYFTSQVMKTFTRSILVSFVDESHSSLVYTEK